MFIDSYEGEPEWNAENCNKKQGATTFETCGWCKYSTGSCRYSCTLKGNCKLMKSYEDSNVEWNTKCKIACLGKADLEAIIKGKGWEINSLRNQISYKEDEKEALEELAYRARYIPPLPSNRPHDYYNVGDTIWVFYEGAWQRGTVVNGYRHHDGCVSYILDSFPESRADKKGPWGCGSAVPGILKDEELVHFSYNYEDYCHYLSASYKSYNGTYPDIVGMRVALFPHSKEPDSGNGYDG